MIKIGVSPINWTNDGDRELGDKISLEQCLSEVVRTSAPLSEEETIEAAMEEWGRKKEDIDRWRIHLQMPGDLQHYCNTCSTIRRVPSPSIA